MRIIDEKISITELKKIVKKMFGELVKAVVDTESRILVIDAGLHSDHMSRGVDNVEVQRKIIEIVNSKISEK